MQKEQYNNIPASLADKVAALTEQTAKRAANICKRRNVPQSVIDAYTADVADMLHGQFNGLRATTEQMQILTDAVPQVSWDRTSNAALCFIAQYYQNIAGTMNGAPILGVGFLHAVEYYEIIQRYGQPITKIYTAFGNLKDDAQAAWEEAQRLYYTYAILIIGELTDVSADELNTMQPNGVDFDKARKARLIASAIDFQQQHIRIEQRAAERKAQRDVTTRITTPTLPKIMESDRTIQQYQNITYALGNGLQTADVDADGRKSALRPLRQAIAEQQQRAELIAQDRYATEQQRKQAAELIATTTAVYQVIDGLQILPQILKPDSGSTTHMGYDLTPYQWAQICTQQEKPNAEAVANVRRATALLRTQSMQVVEKGTRRTKGLDATGNVVRDKNGKPKYITIETDIHTDFMPLHAEFRDEYANGVQIEKATRLHIEIHKIILNGRSNDFITDDSNGRKERLFLKRPATHILTLGQFTDFQSDKERIFRNIIISTFSNPLKGIPAHLREDDLLARVFDYKARQKEYDDAAAAARQYEVEVCSRTTATDEEKKIAAARAKKTTDKAKYYITNHMGYDVDTLRSLFEKALQDGLIKCYGRTEAAHKTNAKKYGSNFIWQWERPDAVTSTRKRR